MLRALAALLIMTAPAAAKMWKDKECTVGLMSQDGGFSFQPHDQDAVRCVIKDWPVDRPDADLSCEDGTMRKMVLVSDDKLVFDGIEMFAVTDIEAFCKW